MVLYFLEGRRCCLETNIVCRSFFHCESVWISWNCQVLIYILQSTKSNSKNCWTSSTRRYRGEKGGRDGERGLLVAPGGFCLKFDSGKVSLDIEADCGPSAGEHVHVARYHWGNVCVCPRHPLSHLLVHLHGNIRFHFRWGLPVCHKVSALVDTLLCVSLWSWLIVAMLAQLDDACRSWCRVGRKEGRKEGGLGFRFLSVVQIAIVFAKGEEDQTASSINDTVSGMGVEH